MACCGAPSGSAAPIGVRRQRHVRRDELARVERLARQQQLEVHIRLQDVLQLLERVLGGAADAHRLRRGEREERTSERGVDGVAQT
eukprot:1229864-Prymnesium_polylepis.1